MERTSEHDDWIAARLAVTEPPWEPGARRARAALDAARLGPTHRYGRPLRLAAAGAAALLAAIAVAPSGRAVAQELWYRLFVSRVEVVRLDLSKMPLDTNISMSGAEQSAASAAEASALAGYAVGLPPAGVLPGVPVLSVLPPMALSQKIDVSRLSAALAAAGAADVDVDADWHGVVLRAHIGRTVSARYPASTPAGSWSDEVTVLQTPPIRLDLPAGFPLDRFAEAIFRAGGLSWWEARALGQEYASHPAWLLDVPADTPVTVETVPIPGGTAVVIAEPADGGASETTVFVSRPDRLYAVSSLSRERSLRVAETLP
jgi:hypothetical protein